MKKQFYMGRLVKPASNMIIAMLMLLPLIGVAQPLLAAPSDLSRPPTLPWETLKFEGSKFLISLDAEIKQEIISQSQAIEELYQQETEQAKPKQPNADWVIKTQIKTEVLGNKSHYTAWHNPDLEILQRTTLYSGFNNWYRNYRFMADQVHSQKIEPAAGENDKPWYQWSDIRSSLHDYRPASESLQGIYQSMALSESAAIFSALTAIKEVDDRQTLQIFNRRGNFVVTLTAYDSRSIKAAFQQRVDDKKSKRNYRAKALAIRVDAKPLDTQQKKTEFKFLGYKNSIVIYYDPELKLPLRLSGEVDYAGHVQIDLKKVRFSSEPK